MSSESRATPQLGDYFSFARRQWPVFAVAAVLAVALSFALLSVLPKSYASSVSVLVSPTGVTSEATGSRTNDSVNLDTEAQVVTSRPVSAAAKDRVESQFTVDQLMSRVSTSVPPNTSILDISFTANTAEGAQLGAEAFASAYLEYRSAQAQAQVQAQLKQLDLKAGQVTSEVRDVNRRLEFLKEGTAARKNAQQELLSLQRQSEGLDALRLPLETAMTDAGSIINPAPLRKTPVSPNKLFVGSSALALMLMLGLAVAWWRDGHLGRIRLVREIESESLIEVLGTVGDTQLVDMTSESDGKRGRSSVQQYRRIVHTIENRLNPNGASLLVVGVGAAPHGQEAAHSLGVAILHTGSDVTLVHSDQSSAEQSVSEPAEPGESSATQTGRLSITSLDEARVRVSGNLQTRGVSKFIETSVPSSGFLVLSPPPVGTSADAMAIAPSVDLTILVIELNRTTREELSEALRQLGQVQPNPNAVAAIAVSRGSRQRRAAAKRRPSTLGARLGTRRHDSTEATGSTEHNVGADDSSRLIPVGETAQGSARSGSSAESKGKARLRPIAAVDGPGPRTKREQ